MPDNVQTIPLFVVDMLSGDTHKEAEGHLEFAHHPPESDGGHITLQGFTEIYLESRSFKPSYLTRFIIVLARVECIRQDEPRPRVA